MTTERTLRMSFQVTLIFMLTTSLTLNTINCASFSSASVHHKHHHQEPQQIRKEEQQQQHRLVPPPSPMSAALRQVRAPASLEIMPMGDIKKAVGESFVVICRGSPGTGSSGPIGDLKWFNPQGAEMFPSKDISIIGTNNHERKQLAFLNPTINDAGVYTCSGRYQNSAEQLEAKVRVVIYEGIVWQDCPETAALVKGRSNEVIKCTAASNPAADVTWFKDNQPVDTLRYRTRNYGLEIGTESTELDAGTYIVTAIVMETGQLEQRQITVETHIKPMIMDIEMNGNAVGEVEAVEGESLTINCRATATPRSSYSWLSVRSPTRKSNLSEIYGYSVDTEVGTLTIHKVKPEDDGMLVCRAENAAGHDEREIKVNVMTKPVITSFRNVSAPQGDNQIKLECRSSGNPLPSLSLRKEGDTSSINGQGNSLDVFDGQYGRISVQQYMGPRGEESILIVTINSLEKSDDGLYSCQASNKAGSASQLGHLEVQFKPDLESNKRLVKTWKDHSINITCIANSIPNATIKWFDSMGNSLEGNYRYQIRYPLPGTSDLTVDPRQEQAYGDYKCEAENVLGSSSIVITLEEAFPPGNIDEAIVIKKSPQSISFKFNGPSNDGGLPITKYQTTYYELNNREETMRTKTWIAGYTGMFTIDNLRPETKYKFKFRAMNDAGTGPEGADIEDSLPNESQPERVMIIHDGMDCCSGNTMSRFSQDYLLRWNEPDNNGRQIESYDIKYYKVIKKEDDDGSGSSSGIEWIQSGTTEYETISSGDELSYRLQNLQPSTYYKVEITAKNSLGNSLPSFLVFRTADFVADGSDVDAEYTGAIFVEQNTMILIASVMIMILSVTFILIDVTCCFMNDTGLIFCMTRSCSTSSAGSTSKGSHQQVINSTSSDAEDVSDEEITLKDSNDKQKKQIINQQSANDNNKSTCVAV